MPASSPAGENPSPPRPHERLLSRMRHDLRTPISAILGYSELLADDVVGEISEPQRQMVRRIGGCALELEQMVDALVTLLRVELEVLPAAATETRAGELARMAAESYANRPDAIDVTVEVRADCALPTDPRAALELLEQLIACVGLRSAAERARLTLEVADGHARYALAPEPPLPPGFWEMGGPGELTAEVARALVRVLGGSARLGEEVEILLPTGSP